MEEFEPSSRLGIGNGGVRAKFRRLESKMVEFEPSSKLGIGKLRSLSQIPMLGIENGRVRAQFEALNRKWRSLSQVRGLESEMEEFEQSSRLGIGKWRSSSQMPMLGIGNGRVRASSTL